jgi:hypothetical protein
MKSVLFHRNSEKRGFESNLRKLPELLAQRHAETEPAYERPKSGKASDGKRSSGRSALELMNGFGKAELYEDLLTCEKLPEYIDSGILAKLAVASFRRLGQDVFPASIRYDSDEHVFGMALRDRRGLSVIRAMPPFFKMSLPDRSASVEILSDDAFQCLLRFRSVHSEIRQLIRDAASRQQYTEYEGPLRAAGAGHELYSAQKLWTMEEALADTASSLGRIGPPIAPGPGMESIRQVYERIFVHRSTCPDCHMQMMMEELRETAGLSESLPSGGPMELLRLYAELMNSLRGIDGWVSAVKSHVHDGLECGLVKGRAKN